MARPDQEVIDTFTSITGVSEAAAVQKLEEHHGNLNEAVNAHFSEGDRNTAQVASISAIRDDVMDIDDRLQVESLRQPTPLLPFSRDLHPFSLDPNSTRSMFDDSGQSGSAPVVQDVSETVHNYGHGIREPITIEDIPDDGNDIEEEMIRAAIEASKKEVAMSSQGYGHQDIGDTVQLKDIKLKHVVSPSLQTAEKETAVTDIPNQIDQTSASSEEMRKLMSSNGRKPELELGGSSIQAESEDAEQLVIPHGTSSSANLPKDNGEVEVIQPSSPQQNDDVYHSQNNGGNFPSDAWGGISSMEHDEAVMLEAAMFGGIPQEMDHHFPRLSHELLQNASVGPHPWPTPDPPSPTLTAQRLIREQQDDEYLASLQADREKEMKAKEEAEAALAEGRRQEEEFLQQRLEEQEIERELAIKEASLPQEPTPNDENAITLLVRMPVGSRRGRRFHKSDKLQRKRVNKSGSGSTPPGSPRYDNYEKVVEEIMEKIYDLKQKQSAWEREAVLLRQEAANRYHEEWKICKRRIIQILNRRGQIFREKLGESWKKDTNVYDVSDSSESDGGRGSGEDARAAVRVKPEIHDDGESAPAAVRVKPEIRDDGE